MAGRSSRVTYLLRHTYLTYWGVLLNKVPAVVESGNHERERNVSQAVCVEMWSLAMRGIGKGEVEVTKWISFLAVGSSDRNVVSRLQDLDALRLRLQAENYLDSGTNLSHALSHCIVIDNPKAATRPRPRDPTPPTAAKAAGVSQDCQPRHVFKISSLLFSATAHSIPIDVVRESNLKASGLGGLVGVFVGGTNGIGESTLKEYFECTLWPKAYIIGRGETRANQIIEDVRARSVDAQCSFIKADCTLIKNVDEACREIMRQEKKINILFLSAGFMTIRGRTETSEGIDRKMAVNYYARMRFIHNLMPLLTAASEEGELSRVISVLAAGSEDHIRTDDLGLKYNFTIHSCLAHSVVMTDFMIEELAKRYPGTAFSHSYPGTVKSGITNELSGPIRLAVKILYAVSSPWILQLKESGERHFFQITSSIYPPRKGTGGVEPPEGYEVCTGSDGEKGSGAYLLDWDAQSTGDQSVLQPYREAGLGQKIWDHTYEVFRLAVTKKRPADDSPDPPPRPKTPPNWRAA